MPSSSSCPAFGAAGASSPGVINAIRRQIAASARVRHRDDLAALFEGPAKHGAAAARWVVAAVDILRTTALPQPLIGDDIDRWLPPRAIGPITRA